MQTQQQVASQPASEASFLQQTAARALQGSVTCDGKLSPETHADYAYQAAMALCAKLAKVGA